MTHKNNPASKSVLEGQSFYRIVHEDPLPGFLIPVDESVSAIAIGPDSDFAQYEIYYLDSLAPSKLRRSTVSVDKPWLATTQADLSPQAGYPPFIPGQGIAPGEIYIRPDDVVGDFTDPATGSLNWQWSPVTDLLVFTGPLTSQLPNRSRKKRKGPLPIPDPLVGPSEVSYRFPTYGRRYYDIHVAILPGNPILGYKGSFDLEINGFNIVPVYDVIFGSEVNGSSIIEKITLKTTTTLSFAGTRSLKFLYDALDNAEGGFGRFDGVELLITNYTENPISGFIGVGPKNLDGGIFCSIEFGD